MDSLEIGLGITLLLFAALGSGLWVFVALFVVSICVMSFGLGFSPDRIGAIMKGVVWRSLTTWELAAVPMFIFMGEIITRSDLSARLFRGLSRFVQSLPGGLLHTNIIGSAVFAAVSGSSTATTAIVGKITTAELSKRNYSRSLALGSLAGAGSLGLLIPPSIMLIIYGVLAEVSIAKLFVAGVIPGLLIAALYSGYLGVRCLLNPSLAPTQHVEPGRGVWSSLLDILPVSGLIVIIFGGIYLGYVTPSESAALGVAATLLFTAATRQINLRLLGSALMASTRSSAMICTIVAAASVLSSTIGFLHLPADLVTLIGSLGLSAWELLLLLSLIYVVLGLFLDGISIAVMTLPLTLPLIVSVGVDPLWFGIYLVVMVEVGLITPPVGLNLFVLQSITGEDLQRISSAAVPFFLLLLFAAFLLAVFPGIVLLLPQSI